MPRLFFTAALFSLVFSLGCAAAPAARPLPPTPIAAEAQPEDLPAVLHQGGVDAAGLRCNRDNRWGATLRSDAEAGASDILAQLSPEQQADAALRKKVQGIVFWRLVRAVLIEGDTNNLGAFALRDRSYVDKDGVRRPVLVFRSGLTPRPDAEGSCFRSLLTAGGVRHVVNLFDGDIPVADLVAAERRAASASGASYHTATDDDGGAGDGYGPWRDLLRKRGEDPAALAQASQAVARLIREQILLPGGQPPRGNVHLHCGGGMHRSGMVSGIIERCINGTPLPQVEAHYRYHVGYRDAAHPGGLEEGNLRFIRHFDCGLLR